ncbi:hypothetical protein V7S43_012550 [Phytophthora oleae]|uniref:Uncharacterized protein n=1 Tax=Phytophthora oleae TaxID=2107226 RepID=A0ABD3F7E7_9STRA
MKRDHNEHVSLEKAYTSMLAGDISSVASPVFHVRMEFFGKRNAGAENSGKLANLSTTVFVLRRIDEI